MRIGNLAVLCALIAGAVSGAAIRNLWERPAQAAPAGQPNAVGRYELIPVRMGTSKELYLLDTCTGRVWQHYQDKIWVPLGAPADR